VTYWFLAP